MNRYLRISFGDLFFDIIGWIIFVGVILYFAATAYGQDSTQVSVEQKYKERYDKELFQLADINGDSLVSFAEARKVTANRESNSLGKKRFNSADRNDDGFLTLEEAQNYRTFEVMNRNKAENRAQELKHKHFSKNRIRKR